MWLTEYLEACACKDGGKAPDDISQFLPWEMSEERLRGSVSPE